MSSNRSWKRKMMKKKNLTMRKTEQKIRKVKMMKKLKNQRNMMKRNMKRCFIFFSVYTRSDHSHWAVCWLSPAFLKQRESHGERHCSINFPCCSTLCCSYASVLDLLLPNSSEIKSWPTGMCPATNDTWNYLFSPSKQGTTFTF